MYCKISNEKPFRKNINRFFIVLILSVLQTPSVFAKPYSFTQYQVENGLLNNSVLCISQDKYGFMWFGTRYGINRFDGHQFKNYFPDQNYKRLNNQINCLVKDNFGQIWAGLDDGIYYYNSKTDEFSVLSRAIQKIRSIYFDQQNRMWIASKSELYLFDEKRKKLINRLPNNKFRINCITSYGDFIWIGNTNGDIISLNSKTNKTETYNLFSKSSEQIKSITKIVINNPSQVLVGTMSQGLKSYNPIKKNHQNLLNSNKDKSLIYVRDILKIDENKFWIATESGIYIYDEKSSDKFVHIVKNTVNNYSLSDNATHSLFLDKENGIWVGTYFGGVNYFNENGSARFRKYLSDNTENSLSGNAVREICGDKYGNIWIGTEDAGLNKLDIKSEKITQIKPTGKPNDISYHNIHGLVNKDDKIWIGTYHHGLDILDIKNNKISKHYSADSNKQLFTNNFITTLLYTKSKVLYVGTEHSLYKYDSRKQIFPIQIPQKGNERLAISCLFEDSKGIIWIGTYSKGLYSFNPNNGEYKYHPYLKNQTTVHLNSNRINCVFEDSQYNLWIGTEGGGLCVLDKKTNSIYQYVNENGFNDDIILKIQEDNSKNLWIGTSQGLIKLDKARRNHLRYTTADGLPTNHFNYGSAYKHINGELYFGTTKGMISFNPANFKQDYLKPNLLITSFQINQKEITPIFNGENINQSITVADTIILNYDQSSFNLSFAALSYTAPGSISYQYILDGFQKQWTTINKYKSLYYTNVPPGNYLFRVKAFGKDLASIEEKKLLIIIKPPVWANKWAYLLYTLSALLIIFYFIKTINNRIRFKKEKDIYESKIDFFTSLAHEIKTPLTLIKGPVENLNDLFPSNPEIVEDVMMIERNANRLSDLVTQLMDFRKTEVKGFRLNLNKTDITEVLTECFEDYKNIAKSKNIKYELYLPKSKIFASADIDALQKVFNNLLGNAIKYADQKIIVKLAILTPVIKISFENDGVKIPKDLRKKVFELFYRLPYNRQKGTGIGLTLAKSLTELHGGKLYYSDDEIHQDTNVFIVEIPI